MSGVPVRRMAEADVAQAGLVAAAAFGIDLSTPTERARWETRMRHALTTDPEGSFVTEAHGVVVGVGQAIIREGIWILSLLTVSQTLRRGGDGRALMQATLTYGRGTRAGIVMASNDPRALRLYGSSGFKLEPTFDARGKVDPSLIPELHPDITVVPAADFKTLAPISRAVRGAAHTQDLPLVQNRDGTVFRLKDRGFVALIPGRGVWALAALDEETATALLWHALDHAKDWPEVRIDFISGRQQWAIDVVLAARLPFYSDGAIAVRGNPGPLYPYIPSPPVA